MLMMIRTAGIHIYICSMTSPPPRISHSLSISLYYLCVYLAFSLVTLSYDSLIIAHAACTDLSSPKIMIGSASYPFSRTSRTPFPLGHLAHKCFWSYPNGQTAVALDISLESARCIQRVYYFLLFFTFSLILTEKCIIRDTVRL